MTKNFKILTIILSALIILVAGGFYLWYVWIPNEIDKEALKPNPDAPMLFGKDAYQIDERADGTYIIVDKVGLTAKVPDGWTISKEKTPTIGDEYWVDMLSPDAEKTSYLKKGCGISITTGINKDTNQETNGEIQKIQNGETLTGPIEGTVYALLNISNQQTLQWTSTEKEFLGQSTGFILPLSENKIIDISTSFPPEYKNQCEPIWQDFINGLEIK